MDTELGTSQLWKQCFEIWQEDTNVEYLGPKERM